MKKNILFLGLAAMSLFTVASCSSDDDLQAGMSIGAGDNVVTLALNPGGSGMAVRGARPVTSSEAANNVDKVEVKLYRLVESNYSLVSETENGQTIYEQDVTWSNGTKTANIPLKHLAQGSYKLVARGYNNSTATAVMFDEGAPSTSINWTATQSTGDIEEVFAGELDITVDAEGKITSSDKTLTMNRRVAGFLAYFKNIPTKVNEKVVKSVRVVASNKATKYDIIGGTLASYTANPSSATVNGLDASAEGKETVLCEFQMSEATNWKNGSPTDDSYTFTTDANQVANTVLGGGFMVPFSKVSGKNTLRVELMAAGTGADEAVKTYTVKMPTSYETSYDIYVNHFYSIGHKTSSSGTEGPDPDTPDPDKPVDLGSEEEIILSLSDAWDVVNDMVID